MEKIDVLVAVYNGEKYIKEQLDSLINQTYKNINIIISDDCSKDNSRKILEEYSKKYNNITVYYQEENLGYVKNFEYLLSKVTSKYYMLCDQDDVWIDTKIEESLKKLEKENADLVFTDLEVVNENLEIINKSYWDLFKFRKKIKKYSDYRLVYMYNVVTGCTILSKSEFIPQIIPFVTGGWVIHDYMIALIIACNGKITYLDKPTIKYRQHTQNQVGIKRMYNKFYTFKEFRNFYVQRKIEQFETYVKLNDKFNEKLKKQNIDILNYYKMAKNVKVINFKRIDCFYKLYKNDNMFCFIRNYILVNIPILAYIWFKLFKPYNWR